MEVADQTGEGGKHLSHKARSFLPCDWLICSVCFHLPWCCARSVNCMNEGQIFHSPGSPSTWGLHCKCKLKTEDHESECIYIHTLWMTAVATCFSAKKDAMSIYLSHLFWAIWWADHSKQVKYILEDFFKKSKPCKPIKTRFPSERQLPLGIQCMSLLSYPYYSDILGLWHSVPLLQ